MNPSPRLELGSAEADQWTSGSPDAERLLLHRAVTTTLLPSSAQKIACDPFASARSLPPDERRQRDLAAGGVLSTCQQPAEATSLSRELAQRGVEDYYVVTSAARWRTAGVGWLV